MNHSSRSFKILSKVLTESKINNSGTKELPQSLDPDNDKQSDNNELSFTIQNLQQEYFQVQRALSNENIDPNIGQITQNEDNSDKDWIENLEENCHNTSESNKTGNNETDENNVSFGDNTEEINKTKNNSEEEENIDQTNKKRKRKKNRLSDSNDWEYNSNKKKREKGEIYLGRKDNKFTVKKCIRQIKNRCLCSEEKRNAFASMENLPNLYQDKLKIKKEKFEHLLAFKSTMEQDYHAFYDSLVHE
ncbi:unnamed protein product [Psylliodes chrysocephalus]|uniref:Uncharacterized protein n=1 Tax=Psylliodes chrysocephalus TaxID=3402493 RepID=A0A9P0GEF0_9CUCU|nr:unnamed protein product [Psylliodes chrysocephala]